MLPPDLLSAEAQAMEGLNAALAESANGRWTLEFRFEGLRLLPLVLRLGQALQAQERQFRLVFPDAGATALAQRDAPDLAARTGSLKDQERLKAAAADPVAAAGAGAAAEPLDSDVASAEAGDSSAPQGTAGDAKSDATPGDTLLLLVAPGPSDYDAVERLCLNHRGGVVLLNGSLEDVAVGIGSVARERRRGFLSTWRSAYALLPLPEGALRRCFPGPWELYRNDPDGHRLVETFEQKPDAEQVAETLSPGQAATVAGGLQALDRFLGSLRN
ncbi:DUF1995 family protein [Synechococcus sp. L2F]|uniref:DUF1995 family protein n=1 Tax=Synechococcus sp. L2F TaxID=2823739 RepID=UPI0020CBA477|nr:DUF1995 family protein [Synechococcus sp. L2F]